MMKATMKLVRDGVPLTTLKTPIDKVAEEVRAWIEAMTALRAPTYTITIDKEDEEI